MDCTGDGAVGFLAGADNEVSADDHLGASNLWNVRDAKDVLKCECTDTNALGSTVSLSAGPAPFPRCPWAVDLTDKPFPGRINKKADKNKAGEPPAGLGGWYWESGFSKDPIADVEWIRDQNFRAMYGAWDALKNVDKLYPNYKLGWAAFIAGKRESRRLLGDVILAADDFRTNRVWPDGVFPCSWAIDLHSPNPAQLKGRHEGEEFIARSDRVSEGIRLQRAVLGAVSEPLQPQREQPVHGGAGHQRDARRSRAGARDAHLRDDGRSGGHGGIRVQGA